ncbi:MAG: DMT family transporter [Bacteroidales bacterium]|nr:DMT family transporter [Bacteroidales bacterium]
MRFDEDRASLPRWVYILVLISATVIWGGNFVVAKGAVEQVGGAWVTGIRFLTAGFVMLAVFFPRIKKAITADLVKAGVIIGVFSCLGYGFQFWGLEGTTPSKNAFLSACYCVTVPFIWWLVARRRPTGRNLLAAGVCLAGMALVTLNGEFTVSWGDGVSILSAVLYGAEIVSIAMLLKDHDILAITAIQMITSGILAIVGGMLTSGFPGVDVLTRPDFAMRLLYIILLGSCYATVAQNVAQKHLPPTEASLLISLESVFGTVFSVIFYGEEMTLKLVLGFALIFGSILLSELGNGSLEKSEK